MSESERFLEWSILQSTYPDSLFTEGEDDYNPFHMTCKYCGESSLMWIQTSNGWRLSEDGSNVHDCRKRNNK